MPRALVQLAEEDSSVRLESREVMRKWSACLQDPCALIKHTSASTVSQHDSNDKRDTRTILNNKDGSPDALQADGFPREATSLWAALGHWEASQGQWLVCRCAKATLCLQHLLRERFALICSECNGILVCLVIVQKDLYKRSNNLKSFLFSFFAKNR